MLCVIAKPRNVDISRVTKAVRGRIRRIRLWTRSACATDCESWSLTCRSTLRTRFEALASSGFFSLARRRRATFQSEAAPKAITASSCGGNVISTASTVGRIAVSRGKSDGRRVSASLTASVSVRRTDRKRPASRFRPSMSSALASESSFASRDRTSVRKRETTTSSRARALTRSDCWRTK